MSVTEDGKRTVSSDDFNFGKLQFKPEQVVYDIVYDPPATLLLRTAAGYGCRTMNGLRMLFWQGIFAYEIWTGIRIKKEFLLELYPAFLNAAMVSGSKESL
jgi:shikimate dehydrogenase